MMWGESILEIYEALSPTPKRKAEEAIKVISDYLKPKERKDCALLSLRKLKKISEKP